MLLDFAQPEEWSKISLVGRRLRLSKGFIVLLVDLMLSRPEHVAVVLILALEK